MGSGLGLELNIFMMQTFMNVQTVPGLVGFHTDITGEDDALNMSLDMVPDVLPHGASLPTDQTDQLPLCGGYQRVNLSVQGGS